MPAEMRNLRRDRVGARSCSAFAWMLAMALASVASAAGKPDTSVSGSAGPLKRVTSLRVLPAEVTLWGGKASQRVLVLGRCADGVERDVTLQSSFSLADSLVAELETPGRVRALADGQTLLKVEHSGQSVEVRVLVAESKLSRPFSFQRDIGGLFTKLGCNASDCHASVKGKGGLKLSLNALFPREDYRWILEGGSFQVLTAAVGGEQIPRIDLKEPESSLLLLKGAGLVSHGGKRRFSVDSVHYETILKWVKAGAPFGEENQEKAVQIARLEVFPRETVLDTEGKQQLVVRSQLSNGRVEDVTDQVQFVSNNPEVVSVTQDGLVFAVRTGETAVMIRAAGQAVTATFGVIARPLDNYPRIETRNFIDEHVFAKLLKFNVIPSELSSDEEFLRRVCLDLTGTLPPPSRLAEFLANKDPQKRDKLIDLLLDSPEYIDYWTFRFSDIFRVAVYVAGLSAKASQPYWEWIRNSIAENKPYDRIAMERISAQGAGGPSAHFMPGEFLPESNMSEEVRVFLGRRFDCAQCHNHPYETWSQDQFWGLAAFFGRMTQMADFVVADTPGGGFGKGGSGGPGRPFLHPRTKMEVPPTFLDGTVLPEDKRRDIRMELAKWMTSQPYFAEAGVNRMWSYFFGRGIVQPVDDFRSTNPPTHPELLEALAIDFKQHGFDLKHLIRTIVQSRTYQLSSVVNETNKEDVINYSHSLPRPLDAEVLLDAISQITGVSEVFNRMSSGAGGREPRGTRALELKESDAYPCRFMEIYGRTDRAMVPERDGKANLQQALHMLAGVTYTDKLSRDGGRLDGLFKSGASNAKIVEELCLAALSRYPSEEELAVMEKMIEGRPSRREALEDMLWGLLGSREFAYNH